MVAARGVQSGSSIVEPALAETMVLSIGPSKTAADRVALGDARALFVSPHLDDAVFSAGGILAERTRAGEHLVILTLFAGDPGRAMARPRPSLKDRLRSVKRTLQRAAYGALGDERHDLVARRLSELDGPPYVRMRRSEDAAAALTLGVSYVWLDFLDAIYRDPSYRANDEAMLGPAVAADAAMAQDIAAQVLSFWRVTERARVVLPLAIGGHVDHRIACGLAGALHEAGVDVAFYEDFPYVTWTDAVGQERRDELGLRLVAETTDVTPSYDLRLDAMSLYGSQVRGSALRDLHRQHAARVAAEAGMPANRFAERLWRWTDAA